MENKLQHDIIPVLEDIVNRIYKILEVFVPEWGRNPVPLYHPWSRETEDGHQFLYARHDDLIRDENSHVIGSTRDFILLQSESAWLADQGIKEKTTEEESYILTIYLEEFLLYFMRPGPSEIERSPISTYTFVGNYLCDINKSIRDEFGTLEWELDPYTIVFKRMAEEIGFMGYWNIIGFPSYQVSDSNISYREDIEGLVIDLKIDIIDHRDYEIEGKQYQCAKNSFHRKRI